MQFTNAQRNAGAQSQVASPTPHSCAVSGQAVCCPHLSDPKAFMCFFGYKMPCSRAAAHQVPSVPGENKRHCFSLRKQTGTRTCRLEASERKSSCSGAGVALQCSGGPQRCELRLFPPDIWDLTRVAAVCAGGGAWPVSAEGIAQKPMGIRRTVGLGGDQGCHPKGKVRLE